VIYQLAVAMIYPSFYEGFGAPVLEALWSRLPVITSNVSCLPEVGGPGALCVDPNSAEDMAEAIKRVYTDKELVADMIAKGIQHTEKFTPQRYVASVMDVYRSLMV
jgi:glycosyltransferase involved in cell wall biosynthesis